MNYVSNANIYNSSSLLVRYNKYFPCLFLADPAPSSLGLPVTRRGKISLSRTPTHEESSISIVSINPSPIPSYRRPHPQTSGSPVHNHAAPPPPPPPLPGTVWQAQSVWDGPPPPPTPRWRQEPDTAGRAHLGRPPPAGGGGADRREGCYHDDIGVLGRTD